MKYGLILAHLSIIKYLYSMKELKKRVKESGFLQTYLAAKIGVSPAYFSMMLSGKATMPEEARNRLTKILDGLQEVA